MPPAGAGDCMCQLAPVKPKHPYVHAFLKVVGKTTCILANLAQIKTGMH